MKRHYYRKPSTEPLTQPSSSRLIDSIQDIRSRIFNVMLISGAAIGLLAVIVNLISDLPLGNWDQIIIYSLAFICILAVALLKKLPYQLRTIVFLTVPYLLGLITSIQEGIAGNGRVWLLGFVCMASILLGVNAGIASMILSLATLLLVGLAMDQDIIPAPLAYALPRTNVFIDWVASGSVWLLIAVIIVASLLLLVQGLGTSLLKEKSLTLTLTSDRVLLSQRTQELDRRLLQLRSAAEVSRAISAVLDQEKLLQQVVDLVRERFELYYAGVFLLDETGEYAILRAGTGEAGQRMLEMAHKLEVGGTSMVGWAISNRKPRIALDVGHEAVRFNNPLLPLTRSEMALPLLSGDQILGAVTLQSSEPEAFDDEDIMLLQSIADGLATAMQNALLFQQAEKNIREIQALNRQYVVDAWSKFATTASLQQFEFDNEQVIPPDDKVTPIHFPIILREQQIGQLTLETHRTALTAEDSNFVEQVTQQAVLAMENVRLLEETQKRASHQRLITEIAQKSLGSTDPELILQTTLGELGKALAATEGTIFLKYQEDR